MLEKIGENMQMKKDKLLYKINKINARKERNRCKICGGMKTDADRKHNRQVI